MDRDHVKSTMGEEVGGLYQRAMFVSQQQNKRHEKCPVCQSKPSRYAIDNINLDFLNEMGKGNTINPAVSLARIVWESLPQLRLTADSKTIIEGLSKNILEELRLQVNDVLTPMKVFLEFFPKLIERLPDEVRKDVEKQFEETRIRLEEGFRIIKESTPTFQSIGDAIQTVLTKIEDITHERMDEIKSGLEEKIRVALKKSGFPEPEQMKLLAQLVPSVLPLLQELLKFQKVPGEKGRYGELELLKEINDHFPGDGCKPLGSSGDTDILAEPRYNGMSLGGRVLIESKENHSGWSRSYLEQVQRHMKVRGERLAILAVEVMPSGANGFMVEPCSEGVILVSSRDNFRITYGALRAILIALQPFNARQVDIKKILADKRIEEAIAEAFQYHEYLKNIRRGTQKIINNAKDIAQNAEDLDSCLKQCLKQLQQRINSAVHEIN